MGNNREPGKRRRNESPSAFAVEVEYEAIENSPPRAHGPVSATPDTPGVLTESQRRKRVIDILAEAVYGYLKKKGKLNARADHVAGNPPETGPSPDATILDEYLDFQAQPTGTCDCHENG